MTAEVKRKNRIVERGKPRGGDGARERGAKQRRRRRGRLSAANASSNPRRDLYLGSFPAALDRYPHGFTGHVALAPVAPFLVRPIAFVVVCAIAQDQCSGRRRASGRISILTKLRRRISAFAFSHSTNFASPDSIFRSRSANSSSCQAGDSIAAGSAERLCQKRLHGLQLLFNAHFVQREIERHSSSHITRVSARSTS